MNWYQPRECTLRKIDWLQHLVVAGAMLLTILGLYESIAEARVGGGHSYSGGSSSGGGSGGGGGGGGELVYLLIHLIIRAPHIGIPIAVVVGVGYWWVRRQKSNLADWDSSPSVHVAPGADLEQIRDVDPDFSTVLFEDFVYRLYAQAHGARNNPSGLSQLAPYLSEEARTQLASRSPSGSVTNVVIGAMRPNHVHVPELPEAPDGHADYIYVDVEFESNMTVTTSEEQHTYYVIERWSLARAATAQTRAPTTSEHFPCPNCGAPFQSSDNAHCEYCNEIVNTGRFDWLVTNTIQAHATEQPPALTATVVEQGTDLPTYFHHAINRNWQELTSADPATTEETLGARVILIYNELNEAWTNLDLAPARPYVSDGLYDYLRYWIEAYTHQGLRNVLEDMNVTRWAFAKLIRDTHFDALTIRLWASGVDYTVVANTGKVVSGSKRTRRAYSEYWTFIRAAKTKGSASAEKSCPKCGAPVKISMSGNCEYCDVHITSGEFDWILSKIEQDDSYRG